MSGYFLLFRWLPPSLKLTPEQLARLSDADIEAIQEDRRQAWRRLPETLRLVEEAQSQLLERPTRRRTRSPSLELLAELKREERDSEAASNPGSFPLPGAGDPVWLWSTQSKEFAKILTEELNRRLATDHPDFDAARALGARFAFVEAESFDQMERARIQACISEVLDGAAPAVSGADVASDVAKLAIDTARRLWKECGPVAPATGERVEPAPAPCLDQSPADGTGRLPAVGDDNGNNGRRTSKAKDPSARKVKGRNINGMMLDAIMSDSNRQGWTAKQWAGLLKCAQSTVVGTKAWKELTVCRETLKAERSRDRRRRPKGSETKRE